MRNFNIRGRFAISLLQYDIANIFQAIPSNTFSHTPNYNVCPTNDIHAISFANGKQRLKTMRWAFYQNGTDSKTSGPY